jgi:hypothetical protein
MYYKIDECNRYVRYKNGSAEVVSSEIGLLFYVDRAKGTIRLLRFGTPYIVRLFSKSLRKLLQENDAPQILGLVHVEGRPDVAELNRCIASPGYWPTFLPQAIV